MSDADHVLRAALEDRLRFERLVCDLSARFVNLEPEGVDAAIQDAQRHADAPFSAPGQLPNEAHFMAKPYVLRDLAAKARAILDS